MRAKFSELQQTHGLRLPAKFRLDLFILSSCGGKKPQFLPFFGLWHLVMSPSKSFLYSNAFMVKSGAQSLTFKSVTDRQTDKQTDKKLNVFGHPSGG